MCKNGNSDVVVNLSELDIEYSLISISNGVTVSTVVGNGGNAILNTGNITDSSTYVVTAKSIYAECEKYLNDTVTATVIVKKIDLSKRRVFFDTICKVKNKIVIDGEAELFVP